MLSNSFKIELILDDASIAFAPSLRIISKVTASSPFTLAYDEKSLKVLLISATSPKVTIASFVTLIGIEYTSWADSITLGTSILKLPLPVS